MKKNKKLFAILTLVAFMMTLVPALAFADTTSLNVTATVNDNSSDSEKSDIAFTVTSNDNAAIDEVTVTWGNQTKTVTLAAGTASDTITVSKTAEAQVNNLVAVSGDVTSPAQKVTVPASAKQVAQAKANQAAADAFVAFAKDTTAGNLTAFKLAYMAAGTGQDANIAALVNGVDAAGFNFDAVSAADVKTIADLNDGNEATGKAYLVSKGVILDTVAPVMTKAEVTNDTTLVMTFDKAVTGSAVAGDFTVKVEGTEKTATAVTVSGKTVTCTFAANTFAAGDTITVAYTGTGLTNADGTKVAQFGATAVTNSVVKPSDNQIDFSYSVYGAKYANGGNPSVDSIVQTNVLFMNKDGKDLDNAEDKIIIWAEDVTNTGVPTTALTVNGAEAAGTTGLDKKEGVFTITAKNDKTINLTFSRAGEYNIYAAKANQDAKGDTTAEVVKNTAKMKQGNSKIVVNALATDPRETYTATISGDFWSNSETLRDGETSKQAISVKANNVAYRNVTVTMKNEGNRLVGKTVNIETNSANLTASKKSAVTNSMGQIDFDLSGSREGTYYVFLSCDGFEVKLQVTVGNTAAAYIAVDSQPDAPIALYGNEEDLDIKVSLTDINGNVVKDGNVEGVHNAFDNTTKYVSFTEKPAGTNLKDKDLSLAYNKDNEYYVKVAQTFDKEGSYEIKIVLDNGNYVTVPFEVKRFETPVQILLDYNQTSIELNGTSNIPTVKYVDANGTKQSAKNKVTIAATGYAIAKFDTTNGQITVKNDEKYIGQTITVTAVDSRYNLTATQTLTVADEAQNIKFDTTSAKVNANNKIDFHVVDANGNTVALGNNATVKEINFIITSKPEGAKVSAVVSGNAEKDLKSEGKATMALTSDKVGDVTVQVLVSVEAVSENSTTGLVNKYYTGTETFKVGKEAGNKTQVVMSIGSHELVKNGEVSTIDAAPMIQDNRTFVPFRALAEAFGATVEFDATNNTVTAKLDGTTVVLTIGSSVMTVGDEAKTLDVAPFISGDRTMVPVRAVAEAFGFNVEATSNPDGTTADVVFTK